MTQEKEWVYICDPTTCRPLKVRKMRSEDIPKSIAYFREYLRSLNGNLTPLAGYKRSLARLLIKNLETKGVPEEKGGAICTEDGIIYTYDLDVVPMNAVDWFNSEIRRKCGHRGSCPVCGETLPSIPSMTNRDRLRNMSDAELGEWLDNKLGSCAPNSTCEDPCDDCAKCWEIWLGQGVKE